MIQNFDNCFSTQQSILKFLYDKSKELDNAIENGVKGDKGDRGSYIYLISYNEQIPSSAKTGDLIIYKEDGNVFRFFKAEPESAIEFIACLRGTKWYNGSEIPETQSDVNGSQIGDYYLCSTNKKIYQLIRDLELTTVWVEIMSLGE